jgi:hypothetical protein
LRADERKCADRLSRTNWEKAPSTNIQAPEKFQAPNTKHPVLVNGRHFGLYALLRLKKPCARRPGQAILGSKWGGFGLICVGFMLFQVGFDAVLIGFDAVCKHFVFQNSR